MAIQQIFDTFAEQGGRQSMAVETCIWRITPCKHLTREAICMNHFLIAALLLKGPANKASVLKKKKKLQ